MHYGKEKEYVILSIAGENIKLEQDEILYVEVNRHYLMIHTAKDVYEVKMSLAEMSETLTDAFVATHRSFMVNLEHVERVMRTECLLSDGSSVPISRNCYKAVNEAFIRNYSVPS